MPSQSKGNGGKQIPSTESQWDMIHLLREECEELGLTDLHVSSKAVRTPAHLPDGFAGLCR